MCHMIARATVGRSFVDFSLHFLYHFKKNCTLIKRLINEIYLFKHPKNSSVQFRYNLYIFISVVNMSSLTPRIFVCLKLIERRKYSHYYTIFGISDYYYFFFKFIVYIIEINASSTNIIEEKLSN